MLSYINYQLSDISYLISTISYQISTIRRSRDQQQTNYKQSYLQFGIAFNLVFLNLYTSDSNQFRSRLSVSRNQQRRRLNCQKKYLFLSIQYCRQNQYKIIMVKFKAHTIFQNSKRRISKRSCLQEFNKKTLSAIDFK